ncbi:hypothetical protein Moror_2882 [Moniliophthora roreri MCA 2997]|uniref:Uncharacterized protein n=1 Tax=Moniliophthora roreri (strain MCA 2997) TaxID=1381753 RepID=V2WWN3_MONRO|nr:hypothetical protein Moror_2882 [Moniliophthora roreri MCA 2997]
MSSCGQTDTVAASVIDRFLTRLFSVPAAIPIAVLLPHLKRRALTLCDAQAQMKIVTDMVNPMVDLDRIQLEFNSLELLPTITSRYLPRRCGAEGYQRHRLVINGAELLFSPY